MKKLLLLSALMLTILQGISQTKGISYQAVILNPQAQEIPGENAQGNILANTSVGIQFTISDGSGNEQYQESHSTSTDIYGMINVLIGNGSPTGSQDFSDIVWNGTIKKLEVGIDFSGGTNYQPLSEQNLHYVPQPATEQVTQEIAANATAIANEKTRAIAAAGVLQTAIDFNACTSF